MTLLAHLKDVADSGAIWRDAAGTTVLDESGFVAAAGTAYGDTPVGWAAYDNGVDDTLKHVRSVANGVIRLANENTSDGYQRLGVSIDVPGSVGVEHVVEVTYRVLSASGNGPTVAVVADWGVRPGFAADLHTKPPGEWQTFRFTANPPSQSRFYLALVTNSLGQYAEVEVQSVKIVRENAATLQGTTLDVAKTAGPGGEITDAVTFDGVDDDHATLPPVLNAAGAYTMAAWVNSVDNGLYQAVVDHRDSGTAGLYLFVTNAGAAQSRHQTGTTDGTESVADQGWKHIATTWDGTTNRVFVDGVEDQSRSVSIAFSNATQAKIGQESFSSGYDFDGQIADVRVYDSDESANIADIYAEGVTSATCSIDAPPNRAGDTLTAVASTNNTTASLLIEWIRADDSSGTNAEVIPGATGIHYTTTDFDRGIWIAARATATGANDSAVTTSSYVRVPVGLVFHLDETPESGVVWANAAAVPERYVVPNSEFDQGYTDESGAGPVPTGWDGYQQGGTLTEERWIEDGVLKLRLSGNGYGGVGLKLPAAGYCDISFRWRRTQVGYGGNGVIYDGAAVVPGWVAVPPVGEWQEVNLKGVNLSSTAAYWRLYMNNASQAPTEHTAEVEIDYIRISQAQLLDNSEMDGSGTTPADWTDYVYPAGASDDGTRATAGSITTLDYTGVEAGTSYYGFAQTNVLTAGRAYRMEVRWRKTASSAGTVSFIVFSLTAGASNRFFSEDLAAAPVGEWQVSEGTLVAPHHNVLAAIAASQGESAAVEIDYVRVYEIDGAVLNGAASFADVRVDGPGGAVQSGFDLNGTDQKLVGPLALDVDTSYTLATWVNCPLNGSTDYVIATRDSTGGGPSLAVVSNRTVAISSTALVTAADSVFGENEWHHIAVVFDRSGGRCYYYLDGQPDGDYANATTWSDIGSVYFGNRGPSGDIFWYDGKIADPRVYDRALTAAEVRSLHARGLTGQGGRLGNILPAVYDTAFSIVKG